MAKNSGRGHDVPSYLAEKQWVALQGHRARRSLQNLAILHMRNRTDCFLRLIGSPEV